MIKWDRIWKTRLMRLNTPGLNHSNYISNLSDDFRHYGRILLGKVNENARSVIGCNDHGRPINVHTRKMARSKEWTLSTTMTQFSIFFFIPPHVLSYMLYIIIKRKKKPWKWRKEDRLKGTGEGKMSTWNSYRYEGGLEFQLRHRHVIKHHSFERLWGNARILLFS